MNKYKQILEAILKGLNFALDDLDLDNNEDDFSLSKQLYKAKSMNLEYIENAYFVDLGLPSGTKWCKYNLGCDFELLSSKPKSTFPKDWYGDYYAWGEVESNKGIYTWRTYEYAKNDIYELSKYCTKSKYGYEKFTDNLTELLPEDDVAYKANSSWRIPTKKLCQELIDYTDSKWISGIGNNLYMNVKGLAGRLFISKTNGNQLFIPAAGYKLISHNSNYVGNSCYIWSSSLSIGNPRNAWGLCFYADDIYMDDDNRYYGQCVRPVMK